jgi:competence protein ComEA
MVYVIAGILVLIVGTIGLLSMRSSPESGELIGGEILPVDGFGPATGDSVTGMPSGAGVAAAASTTTTTSLIYVQVAGAVRRPGVYRVSSDARLFEAVAEAGGFTEEADQQTLTLAAKLSDGCRIYVPRVGEAVPESTVPTAAEAVGASQESAGVVSLNSGTFEQLDSLPGIGPAIAQDIVSYREAHGPFTSVDQLTDVPGIGPARLEQLRPLVGL